MKLKPKIIRDLSESNPIILRGNPRAPLFTGGVTLFSQVNLINFNAGDKFYELYRIDKYNVNPKLITTLDKTCPVFDGTQLITPSSSSSSSSSTIITGSGMCFEDSLSNTIQSYFFVDLDEKVVGSRLVDAELSVNTFERYVENGVLTDEGAEKFRNTWFRYDDNNQLNTDDPANLTTLNNKPHLYNGVINRTSSVGSQLLTEFDHDSPNDDFTGTYEENGTARLEPNLIVKNNGDQKPSLIEAYGRLWASSGRFLRFSKPGEPEYWPRQNSLSFNDNITGLIQISSGILVFTADETYLVIGTKLDDFAVTLVTKEQGCIAPRSCNYIQSTPLWLSKDGIATYEGGRVVILSRNAISKEDMNKITQDDKFICAEVHDEQYFILYNSALPNTGAGFRNKTTLLTMDLRYGVSFYKVNGYLNNNNNMPNYIRDLRMYEDKLYAIGSSDNKIYEMFAADTGTDEEQYYSIEYVSPTITMGNNTGLKECKSVFIAAKGSAANIEYSIDGKPFVMLMENFENIVQEIMMPVNDCRFNEIKFKITGIVKDQIREIQLISKLEDSIQKNYQVQL